MYIEIISLLVIAGILFAGLSFYVRDRKLLIIAGGFFLLAAVLVIYSGVEFTVGSQIKQPVKSSPAFFLNETFYKDNGYSGIQIADRNMHYLTEGDEHILSDYDESVNADDLNMICTGNITYYGSIEITAAKSGVVYFYEETTFSDSGTPCNQTQYCNDVNKNRYYSDENDLTFYEDPTIVNNGTRLVSSYIPASTENKGIGGISGETNWLLNRNTCYLLEYVPESAGSAASFRMVYNEVKYID